MKIPLQKSHPSALAALIVFPALPCEAIPTTTVVVAGMVKSKVPDKPRQPPHPGVPLAGWQVGIYTDETPSEAAHRNSGNTDTQGLYNISVENLANVRNIWVFNEEPEDQKPGAGQAKPAHVLVQLPRDMGAVYPKVADELDVIPKAKALAESDAASVYTIAIIFDQALRVFLHVTSSDRAEDVVRHLAEPVIDAEYKREPDRKQDFWNAIWDAVKSIQRGRRRNSNHISSTRIPAEICWEVSGSIGVGNTAGAVAALALTFSALWLFMLTICD
jgi:hypothetical protein